MDSHSTTLQTLFKDIVKSPGPFLWFLSGILVFYIVLILGIYILYQRKVNPLSKYPGPFLASLTDLWQVWQFWSLKQPYNLTKLHEKYGQFVRYGPNKLSVTAEDAIPIIYQKGGRAMQKTDFYDAFGSVHPNIFGMRDEALHSVRRRHMSHSFSISSVKEMEPFMNDHIAKLLDKISGYAKTGEVFDLKKLVHYYVVDILGELAFSQPFGLQSTDDESLVPPVKEHTLLASITGAWPLMTARLKRWLPLVPVPGIRRLFKGRRAVAALASECVRKKMKTMGGSVGDDAKTIDRKDLLTNLILSKHPDTGESMTQIDLETEAFGFIIAGTHTTAASTTLLFYNLLHAPEIVTKCVAEIDQSLPSLTIDHPAYSYAQVEASLPYLRQAIRESFRITPIFTMPLERTVTTPGGIVIAGEYIPEGTSIAVCNHAFHHDPKVWGPDHNSFDPSRWDEPETAARTRYLMHFGLGGRQCIGKTLAQANIYKLTSTLLKQFAFELANGKEIEQVEKGAFRGKLPPMISVGISDLDGPLFIRAKRRNVVS